MKRILNLKNVKMAVALALMILLVAALIPAPVQAAEVKWYRGEPGYAFENKTKIGDGYFWYEYEYGDDSTKTILRYSAQKSGKGVKLASMEYPYYYGENILFNGTKVYYTTYDYERGDESSKFRIHSVSKTGKNKVTLKTLTVKDGCGYTELLGVYNGRVYFTRFDKDWEDNKTAGKLCSMKMTKDAKTGKYLVSTVNKDFPHADSRGAGSRYIYAQPTYDTIKIFDCKTSEVIRTVKDAGEFYIGSNYIYYKKYDENGTPVLIQTSLTGKNKTVVKKFKNSSYAAVRKTGKMYYNEYNEAGEAKFYEYNLSKKTTVEISESEFMMKAFDGTFGM